MNCTPKLQKNKTKKQWHQSSVSQRLAQNSLWSKITEMLKLALNSQRMFQDLFTHSFFSLLWISEVSPGKITLLDLIGYIWPQLRRRRWWWWGFPWTCWHGPCSLCRTIPLEELTDFGVEMWLTPPPPSPGWYGSSVWLCLPSLCFQRWSLLWAARCENPPSFQSFSG